MKLFSARTLLSLAVILFCALALAWALTPAKYVDKIPFVHKQPPKVVAAIVPPPAPTAVKEATDPQAEAMVRAYFTPSASALPPPLPSQPPRKPMLVTKNIALKLPDGYVFTPSMRVGKDIRQLGVISKGDTRILLGVYLDGKAGSSETAMSDVVTTITAARAAKGATVDVQGPHPFSPDGKLDGRSVVITSTGKSGQDTSVYYMVKDEAKDFVYLSIRGVMPAGKPDFDALGVIARQMSWVQN